jgi:hypothetical protein
VASDPGHTDRYLGPAEYQPDILRLEAIGLLEA